ncbi:MAG: hypothetical protein ABEJ42_06235 [Halobacteriaceae archaeon]
MSRRGVRRRLVRLRYRLERLLSLLLLVVLPVALVAGVVYLAYLGMRTEGPVLTAERFRVPPVLVEAWAPVAAHLSPEGELILLGTAVLAALVTMAWIADRYQAE